MSNFVGACFARLFYPPCAERIDAGLLIGFALTNKGAGEAGLIGCIRKLLALNAEPPMLRHTPMRRRSVQRITGVQHHKRLIGVHAHGAAAGWFAYLRNQRQLI